MNAARRILPLIDLTSLNDDDNAATIERLCAQAVTSHGPVAAVCVNPPFVAQARRLLAGTGIRVATVANFPQGRADVAVAAAETAEAVSTGAQEVDVVMPFEAWLAGERTATRELIEACKAACRNKARLKVILETAVLGTPAKVAAATRDVIAAGADFVKTSTGKGPGGATIEAAEAMLGEVREAGGTVGFKAAGGIRTVEQAAAYLALAERILGPAWATPAHFRFGASSLLNDVLQRLGGDPGEGARGDY
jgi:deoxyribose-phosphate aldolase